MTECKPRIYSATEPVAILPGPVKLAVFHFFRTAADISQRSETFPSDTSSDKRIPRYQNEGDLFYAKNMVHPYGRDNGLYVASA